MEDSTIKYLTSFAANGRIAAGQRNSNLTPSAVLGHHPLGQIRISSFPKADLNGRFFTRGRFRYSTKTSGQEGFYIRIGRSFWMRMPCNLPGEHVADATREYSGTKVILDPERN